MTHRFDVAVRAPQCRRGAHLVTKAVSASDEMLSARRAAGPRAGPRLCAAYSFRTAPSTHAVGRTAEILRIGWRYEGDSYTRRRALLRNTITTIHVYAHADRVQANGNVPVLNGIEMSPGDGLWALCETRRRVLQGAVGAFCASTAPAASLGLSSLAATQLEGARLSLVGYRVATGGRREAGARWPQPATGGPPAPPAVGRRRRQLAPAHYASPITNLDRAARVSRTSTVLRAGAWRLCRAT